MRIAIVEYQYADYRGTVEVNVSENDCSEEIIAQAKSKLKKDMTLPMAYEKVLRPKPVLPAGMQVLRITDN